jgi:thiol:disulfide interchange protein DsbC
MPYICLPIPVILRLAYNQAASICNFSHNLDLKMNIKPRQIINILLLLASSAVLTHTAQAQEIADASATSQSEILTALYELTGQNIEAGNIVESPMQGVYQVDMGNRIVYVSKAGGHLLLGDVFDTQRRVSLSEEIKQAKALAIVEDIQESEMIVFEPEETKRTITVYTDVDCPYCRKLHQEVPTLVENGVKVRYLWFPRSGINTPSYDKAVSIWCAEDQMAAMNDAKLNNKIVDITCAPNPVASQYDSGRRVGVRGTPTIVVDDGTIIGGYLPAKSLLADLGLTSEPIAKAVTQ